ncbi:MAG: class D sortase [Acetanaerobacterium sp.]
MKNERKKRLILLVPCVLIMAGCILIFTAVFRRLETNRKQGELVVQYNQYIATLKEVSDGEEVSAAMQPDSSAEPSGERDAAQPELIGILTIPKIDLTVAVGEGADDDTLKYMVGHIPETATLGQRGNCAISGHRSYSYGQFFNRLDELTQGDSIMVQRDQNTYTYTVTHTFIVEPEETGVLNQTDDAQITLVTCTPVRTATHRLIVKGILTNVE